MQPPQLASALLGLLLATWFWSEAPCLASACAAVVASCSAPQLCGLLSRRADFGRWRCFDSETGKFVIVTAQAAAVALWS
eukprot:1957190-Alexandrium_andersonii.AAC.1